MCMGGDGSISAASNIIPKEISNIISYCHNGEFITARRIHYKVMSFLQSLFSISTNPIPIKSLLAYLNKIKEEFRLPLCALEVIEKEKLIKIYKEYLNG